MGKRSNYKRIKGDAYQTIDPKAVLSLKAFIGSESIRYYEPCAGHGKLIEFLKPFECVGFSDEELDARTHKYDTGADYFITNPPWTRSLLHPIIENLRTQLPTWLLFDADWMHTAQAAPYLKYCKVVLSIGRLQWVPDKPGTGKDNSVWYLFVKQPTETIFVGRQ